MTMFRHERWSAFALVFAVGSGFACLERAEPEPERPNPGDPVWAVVVDHWLPGPHRRGQPSEDRSALEAECRNCHVEIAREWDGSEHAGSWSSAAFQAAFTAEPLPFCQGCHAPEVAAKLEVAEWAAEIGVGCVTCHVEPGTERIWSARTTDAGSAHPTTSSPAFAGPQACAACHEFSFPDAAIRDQPLLMQSTVREHSESAFADRSCADCHMRETDSGHRSHRFLAAYDRDTLARSLIITAEREADRVTLELALGEVGHRVPTGDLLRRLELRLELVDGDGDGSTHTLDRQWLLRTFAPVRQRGGITVRGQVEDSRVGPDGATVRFEIPASARGQTLRWVVTHQRVAHWSAEPNKARIEGQIEFASGLLPAESRD